jgi:protein-disulfide isomerase
MIKTNINFNLSLLIKIIIIYFFIFFKSAAENINKNANIIFIGSEDAVVKIKVFSSATCPHCASFHNNVVPKIKKEYIDTGKVQLIFIDFPLDLAAFNAAKALHCLDKKVQIKFLDIIYATQSEWTRGSNIDQINNNLKKIVKNLGISSDQFDKCIMNEVISDEILNSRINAQSKYSINSTPTIIINEKKLDGSVNFKNIKKKIEKLI